MLRVVLIALLAAVIVGVVWAAVIGPYAAVAALITFIAVVVLVDGTGGRTLP